MGPVGVLHESGVERLDAVYTLRVEVGGVLSRRLAKVRMPARGASPRALSEEGEAISSTCWLVFGHDADVLAELEREKVYD